MPRPRKMARRKMTRRLLRPFVFRPMARGVLRRHRRMMRRRAFRIHRGPWFFLALAGTAAAYKLAEEDYYRIQSSLNESPENLTEKDLKNAMTNLGISKIELSTEEQEEIDGNEDTDENGDSSDVKYCSKCGQKVSSTAKFCEKCGYEL